MSTEAVRIDIWLWRARFLKTRALATGFAAKGSIRIGQGASLRRIEKPSALVRPGDSLTFPLGSRIVRLTIKALGDRRGPAAEARLLYELIPEKDGNHV